MPESSEQVFVCYAHEDLKFAQDLARDLRGAGVSVWWDQPGLKGGQEWDRKVIKFLLVAGFFYLVYIWHPWSR